MSFREFDLNYNIHRSGDAQVITVLQDDTAIVIDARHVVDCVLAMIQIMTPAQAEEFRKRYRAWYALLGMEEE